MANALSGIGKNAPRWLLTLQLAEAWHTPPWDIEDGAGSQIWAARYSVYHEEQAKIRRVQEKRASDRNRTRR